MVYSDAVRHLNIFKLSFMIVGLFCWTLYVARRKTIISPVTAKLLRWLWAFCSAITATSTMGSYWCLWFYMSF